MKLTFSRILSLALVLISLAPCVHAVDHSKKLAPQYRHWINEEVNYIISSEEKKQFLNLQTDAERDHFIEHFWQALNPTPLAQTNPYKQEHYRRLAYANEHYGNIEAQDGWRTDQGRIYITLGAPKQVETYPAARNVRPLEIWFYQGQNRALPPYFNLLFYKRSVAEPFTLYSPYQDGPTRLVTSSLEDLNDPKKSIQTIRKSLGDEVAKTALSLIPGEAVNFDDYTPSLTSDMMLGMIEGLADNPLTRSLKTERKSNEQTISTLYYGGDSTQLETAIFRDTTDRMTASYLIRYREPQAELVGQLPNGHQGYSVTVQATVLTLAGKPVYRDVEQFGGELTNDDQIDNARTKIFGAEGRLPLAPGKYQLLINLTNNLNHAGVRKLGQLTVPDSKNVSWGMSKLLAFASQPPTEQRDAQLPFSIARVRFVPRGTDNVLLHHGEPLRIAYQLWSGSDAADRATRKISVHYAYGSFGAGAHPQDESEEVSGTDFDASGNLLTGRTFPTTDLVPGNYRMVVTAIDEKTQEKAYSTINFRIVDDANQEAIDLWTTYNGVGADKQTLATDDYKRGISAIASGDNGAGTRWLQQSLDDDPNFSRAMTKLVDFYAAGEQDKEIAGLAKRYALTHELDGTTAIRLALASAKIGDLPEAKHIVEFELGFQPPNSKLYQAIAEVYQQMGDNANATEFRKRAAAL